MTNIVMLLKDYPNQINAFAAICALIVSFLSILLTVWTARQQRKHNHLSIKPIAAISFGDYENSISVTIKNKGVGPLLVDCFRVTKGKVEKDSLILWMPSLPAGLCWTNYVPSIDGTCIAQGGEIVALQLDGDMTDSTFTSARDQVRNALSQLTATVDYHDIYGHKIKPTKRDLSWFGRHTK